MRYVVLSLVDEFGGFSGSAIVQLGKLADLMAIG
jgi:hypothetical protein